jgi:copper(I)-binding protein
MFMKLTKNLTAGAQVPVTLVTADGGLMTFKALVKVYNGGTEYYVPSASSGSDMSGMSGM